MRDVFTADHDAGNRQAETLEARQCAGPVYNALIASQTAVWDAIFVTVEVQGRDAVSA